MRAIGARLPVMRRLVATLLSVSLSAVSGASLLRLGGQPDGCGCVKTICACARPAAAERSACHGAVGAASDARMRCHHPNRDVWRPAAAGLLVPIGGLTPTWSEAAFEPAGEHLGPGAPRDIEPPPPRGFLLG